MNLGKYPTEDKIYEYWCTILPDGCLVDVRMLVCGNIAAK